MSEERVRWTIIVSKQTDIAVRMHLARQGIGKGGLSRFVEDAVKRHLLRPASVPVDRPDAA